MIDKPKKEQAMINENINIKKLNVIDSNGGNLGLLDRNEALKLAREQGLDLVLIAVKDGKAIAKILDYGKFKYNQKKKEKDSKKHQTLIKNKEVKVKPLIGDHDLQVRANNTLKWLADGDRVTFIIEARGRMSTKPEYIQQVYDKFMNLLGDNAKIMTEMKKLNDFRYSTVIVANKK